ncbi:MULTISPECIES: hypothetical protein [unclassified Kitasatospora]|uniref:hypothetical protein n=1 Tax=unclassified Kitasatospora TaxID=2633591 RepID=UPI00070E06DE|nr:MULTISPECIES: hypothetical protein [unclassified Kitasatospora]KQV11657.1 hypothetical protein ASC99_09350 [Kitasatospora sp. Root107]KRB76759.1 hypothetical protein ASE03_14035 [Kitasatospora sp. Root187]
MFERDFPALGFDPTPGEPGRIDALVLQLTTSAKYLEDAHATLTRAVSGDAGWQGDAASGFTAKIQPLPRQLEIARQSFDRAARELDRWGADLAGLKSKAHAYEDSAQAAKDRLKRAKDNPDLDLVNVLFTDGDQLADAERRLASAAREVDSAEDELADLRRQAAELSALHEDLSEKCAAALRAAAEEAPDGPGLLARVGESIEQVAMLQIKAGQEVVKFVQDHANSIAAVGDVFSTVSAVTGLVGATLDAIPGGAIIGGPVGIASGVNGLAAFALHGVAKAGGADVSWGKLGEDAISSLTFGIGKTAEAGTEASLGVVAVARGAKPASDQVGGFLDLKELAGGAETLEYFVPRNDRQKAELSLGFLPVIGTTMMLAPAYENAWKAGVEKDRQAAAERGAR